MVLRNIAVITDRLTPEEFAALSKETRDQVSVVAFIANGIAPINDDDRKKRGNESDTQHQYRLAISGPIHSFQSAVCNRGYNGDNQLEISKIRFGVEAAGRAFGSVLNETQNVPEVARTMDYFVNKTYAAAQAIRK